MGQETVTINGVEIAVARLNSKPVTWLKQIAAVSGISEQILGSRYSRNKHLFKVGDVIMLNPDQCVEAGIPKPMNRRLVFTARGYKTLLQPFKNVNIFTMIDLYYNKKENSAEQTKEWVVELKETERPVDSKTDSDDEILGLAMKIIDERKKMEQILALNAALTEENERFKSFLNRFADLFAEAKGVE